jgi:hypothetical protein
MIYLRTVDDYSRLRSIKEGGLWKVWNTISTNWKINTDKMDAGWKDTKTGSMVKPKQN